MKTFDVQIAITVFAVVQIECDDSEQAESLAAKRAIDFQDLKLLEGQSIPEMVFEGQTEEARR